MSSTPILRLLAALVATVAVGCAGEASEAEGDSFDEDEETGAAGVTQQAVSAPACVAFRTWKTDSDVWVRVSNHCGTFERARVIWRWAGDDACRTLRPGDYYHSVRNHKWGPDPYVTEIRRC